MHWSVEQVRELVLLQQKCWQKQVQTLPYVPETVMLWQPFAMN
jgi:hypothetical protein